MSRHYSLICILLAVAHAQLPNPRDLADEAQKQLDELKSAVQGDISVAHNDLESFQLDFETYASKVLESGTIDLEQGVENINNQLNTVKNLGQGWGLDISPCLNGREETLGRLPDDYKLQMSQCMGLLDLQSGKIVTDAKYVIDVTFNKVYELERQLQNCGTDILCISPVVNDIELYKISIPQSIASEVQSAEEVLVKLQISVQDCSDQSVADYMIEAGSIILEMATCVDRLLG